jgi:hypothetical protein
MRLAPVRSALQRLRQGVWTRAPRPSPDEGRNQHAIRRQSLQRLRQGVWTRAPRPSPDEGRNQHAIRRNHRSSACGSLLVRHLMRDAISMQSEAIISHQARPHLMRDAISRNQTQSACGLALLALTSPSRSLKTTSTLAPRSSSTARYTLAVPPVSRSYLMRQVIRGHQRSSEVIRVHQVLLVPDEADHQRSSEVLRGHQSSSGAART